MSNRFQVVVGMAGLLFTFALLGTGCADASDLDAASQEAPSHAQPQASEGRIAEEPFAELGGPHQVGVRDLFLVADDRSEPFTSDEHDRRRLLIRVWYPAVVGTDDQLARYVPEPAEFDGAESFAGVLHVKTRGYDRAQPDRSGGPYPVLIFNPGGGWTRLSDTFWTEQLASHGYVVFAVDHQGFNQSVVFPDGYRFVADQLGFPEESGDLLTDARASWAHLDEHHFPQWLADSRSLLDHIEELASDRDGVFGGLADLDQVGAFGWSFGGATAVQLSRDDPRVKAAVDGDGQLFGDVATTGTQRPVLLLHGEPEPTQLSEEATEEEKERAAAMEELIAEVTGNDRSLRELSPQVWEVSIRGANHGNFSDLVLAGPSAPDAIDPRRGHEIINQLSLAFFDHTLKGKPRGLLDDIEGEVPEAFGVSTPRQ